MSDERAGAWTDLLAGGAASEAFGPLTLEEELDEKRVDEELRAGRVQRWRTLGAYSVVVGIVVIAAIVLTVAALNDDGRTVGAIRFEDLPPTESGEVDTSGGAPVAVPELTTALDQTVSVQAGEGPVVERIQQARFSELPQPPGAVWAGLFQYGGAGHVALVGPDGWVENACVRASVTTDGLRPLDTVWFAGSDEACVEVSGRPAMVVCQGDSAVLLDLRIPAGEVALPEGGVGFADRVRVQLIGWSDDYDVLTVRGQIAVGVESEVTVPRFGGDEGDEISFDLGSGRTGTCQMTGVLPLAT